jgi:rhodanese-related sulfurtransferase
MRTLVSFALVTFATLLVSGFSHAAEAPKPRKIQVEEFDKLRTKPDHVVLDVRTPEEFKQGHVAGAKNIDVNATDFAKQIAALDKSKTYLVHCARGGRSAIATQEMKNAGFSHLLDFTGGFNAWQKAGKPVTKD